MIVSVPTLTSFNSTPAQISETRALPSVGRGKRSSTRAACQNLSYSYPRIPRPVLRQGNNPKATLDSQFQVNASHVQRPLSLVSVSFPSRTFNVSIDTVSGRKPEAKLFGILRSVQHSSRGRYVGAQLSHRLAPPSYPFV